MEKFILFFDTKFKGEASRFPKRHLPQHSPSNKACYCAVVEGRNLRDAWDEVFRTFPDYNDRGQGDWGRIPPRRNHDETLIPLTEEDVFNYYASR